jgi:transcription termination factor Rho
VAERAAKEAPPAPIPVPASARATSEVTRPGGSREAVPFGASLGAPPPPPPPPPPPARPEPPAPPAPATPAFPPEDDPDEWLPVEPEGQVAAPSIPPIPEEADEFEPVEHDEAEGPPREAPPGTSPRDVVAGVRRGRLHVSALSALSDLDLLGAAREAGIAVRPEDGRSSVIARLLEGRPPPPEPRTSLVEGLLELLPDGYGFLRRPETGYAAVPGDAYVPPNLVRRFGLLTGHWVEGTARDPRPGERYPALLEVEAVNHEEPEKALEVTPFERLVVTHPDSRYLLETEPEETTGRLIDLFCPLGRGQRALVVSPPRAGKTIVLQRIADALARNSPEVEIVVLLVDERPEEVTNMKRSVRGEVIASTFDQPAHRHIRLVELVMEKVKRMVEYGRHVVLLVDSLTRIGRAYNNESHGTGRLLTGGLEASALTKPKRIFSAARNIERGGSLTIVATALVDTGSRLDQVIFEEFKGTGNMELVLDRDLANQRLWPAIDVPRSGTRKEELLLHPEEQRRIVALRRSISGEPPAEALLEILEKLEKYSTNAEFLMRVEV